MNKLIKPCSINKISLSDVSKTFVAADNQQVVVDRLSYTFTKGRTFAIMGASGTGKSTLLHLIVGFEEPTSGAIFYDDTNLALCTKKQKQMYLQQAFGILLQNAYLLDELSASENVMLKGISTGRTRQECYEQAITLLETVQLLDKIDALPTELSGGQQQRVALARALFDQPDFVVADEPTGNLDEQTGARMIDVLLENQQKYGMGVILSTHDLAVAQRMDVILELHNGKLHEI
ncbi:MAG: ABC transporter ATP-binding protein [Candidatus Babeliales bacterium]